MIILHFTISNRFFAPFIKTIDSFDFHLDQWSNIPEIISTVVDPDYHFIQEAFNHSITMILQIQGNQFLSFKRPLKALSHI